MRNGVKFLLFLLFMVICALPTFWIFGWIGVLVLVIIWVILAVFSYLKSKEESVVDIPKFDINDPIDRAYIEAQKELDENYNKLKQKSKEEMRIKVEKAKSELKKGNGFDVKD